MRIFPFSPKSNVKLCPGDFWALPLQDGSYACGLVLQLPPAGVSGAKVSFLGGLLNWHSADKPTLENITGSKLIEQGVMHVLAIQQGGGMILGNIALEANAIEPLECIRGNVIQKGYTSVRPWQREDNDYLPLFSYWGYDVISLIAHKHFLGFLSST